MTRAHNFHDLTGQRFGQLIALKLRSTTGKTRWVCRCDCGAETVKAAQHLTLGLTRSCGCLRRKTAAITMRGLSKTHGLSDHPAFGVWAGMMRRCYNARATGFKNYGGRGILVCSRWHDPAAFIADMGAPPASLTLERINNNGSYSPENCRWASMGEQNNNRRSTRLITFGGKTLSAAAWARQIGIGKAAMYRRLRCWPLEAALTAR